MVAHHHTQQQVYHHHHHQAPFELPLTPPNSTPGSSPERQSQSSGRRPLQDAHISTVSSSTTKPINIVKISTKVINGFTISFKEPSPLETPPSTPDKTHGRWMEEADPALHFLKDVFTGRSANQALPFSTSVTIEQEGTTWEGVVLALPDKPKTLYVNGRGAESVQLRERYIATATIALTAEAD